MSQGPQSHNKKKTITPALCPRSMDCFLPSPCNSKHYASSSNGPCTTMLNIASRTQQCPSATSMVCIPYRNSVGCTVSMRALSTWDNMISGGSSWRPPCHGSYLSIANAPVAILCLVAGDPDIATGHAFTDALNVGKVTYPYVYSSQYTPRIL
jgi:hypothetical protein